MNFQIEERRTWVRSGTHTTVFDRDPDFDFFRNDPTGLMVRTLRIWLAETRGKGSTPRAYLGSIRACRFGLEGPELYRLFRKTTACAPQVGVPAPVLRRRLALLLRARLKSN